jgi:hypothetical protein
MNFVIEYYTKFKGILREGSNRSYALIGLIYIAVGSTIITFLNKYALINYAVGYGLRVPAEGVPFLDIAIGLLALAVFGVSVVSVFFFQILLVYLNEKLSEKISFTFLKFASDRIAIIAVSASVAAFFSSIDIFIGKPFQQIALKIFGVEISMDSPEIDPSGLIFLGSELINH